MRGPKFCGRSKLTVIITIMLVMFYVVNYYLTNIVSAEGEKDSGIFKVAVSIIGVTKETGAITAAVTVDGHSKVKTFNSDPGKLSTYNLTNWYVLKFIATFPNVVVDPGTAYKACVVKLNDMHHYCHEGKYSSGKSPEFVNIVLDKKIKSAQMEKKYRVINAANNVPSNVTSDEIRNVLPNYSEEK